MGFLKKIFGGSQRDKDAVAPQAYTLPLARGNIFVRNGSLAAVKKAIIEHSALIEEEAKVTVEVGLQKYQSGWVAISLPQGMVVYELINLIGWLNAPPGIDGVSDSIGVISPPNSKICYTLQLDRLNEWGDTLVGFSNSGKSVSVYLPDAGLCETTREPGLILIPNFESDAVVEKCSFTVEVNANSDFGNPEFIITHPTDTNWNS